MTKASKLAMAAWLAAAAISGCSQKGEPPVIQSGKDAQGDPVVHIDGKQVDRNLEEANKDLKQAGEQVKEGAQDLGQAMERGAKQLDKEVGPVLDDAGITAKIKAKLLADPEVKALHIDVDTVDGRVALNGKVSSAEERAEAEKLASHTEGVKSVVNLIQVAGQAPPAPAAPPSR